MVKAEIVPVDGTVHKKPKEHLKALGIDQVNLAEMQKAVILGTTTIVRRTITKQ